MQERMDDERKREIANDKNRYFIEREKELSHYREIIEKQESELNAYRSRLKEEQYLREKELRKELEERERYFLEREKKLVERQKEFHRKGDRFICLGSEASKINLSLLSVPFCCHVPFVLKLPGPNAAHNPHCSARTGQSVR